MANFFDQFDAPVSREPRGVRNNNPLNIEAGRFTASQPGFAGSDGRFAQFENRDQGFAAAENLLDVYGRKHGINTVSGIINRWAPSNDGNPVSAYAGAVASDLGIGPNDPLDLANPQVRARVADSMARFENGKSVPRAMSFSGEQPSNGFDIRVRPAGSVPSFEGERPQPKNFFDQFDGPAVPQGDTFAERASVGPEPANADALRAGLEQRARQMTTGPAQDHFAGLVNDFQNQGSAAAQGTTPNIGAQSPNLISTETFTNDAGEVLYRDPTTGQVVPTDQNKQIALRDPADGRIKVYARTEDTDEGRLSSAGRILSTGMATGAPTARPAIPTPTLAQQTPRASEIISTAKPHYQQFRNIAGEIEATPEAGKGLADQLRGALDSVNLTEEMAGPAVASAIRMLESGRVKTLADLQKVKRMAGRGFNSAEKDARDAAAAVSGEIGKIIEAASPEAASALKTGDQIHSTARSVQELQRKSDIAGLRAGRAGYGGNAVNSMRQVLSPIVQKAIEGKTTSFKPNEIQAMRDIVEGTTATNLARGVGQLSPSKGVFQTGGALGATYTLGPGALAIPGLGMASNKLATILTGKQIDRLKELVAKRSPEYAKAVEKSVKRYEEAQMKLISDPSPNRFAGYLSASRALAAGLTRDGIQVTSGDLLRNLQLGGVGRAEDEQDGVPRKPGN